MTKRQLIDEIVSMNQSARPGFLARFDDTDLDEYLQHLRLARTPRLAGDPHRYDRYFNNCPAIRLPGVPVSVAAETQARPSSDETGDQPPSDGSDDPSDDLPSDLPDTSVDDLPKAADQQDETGDEQADQPQAELHVNASPAAVFQPSYEAKAG
jgi:hypothetical protein